LGAEEQASMELLEFLGSFETADGKWIDPTRLEPVMTESRKRPVAPGTNDAPAEAEEKTHE
jgi:hypothetical protein